MVSTPLQNISQIGSFPQVGVKIKNIWNHHPVLFYSFDIFFRVKLPNLQICEMKNFCFLVFGACMYTPKKTPRPNLSLLSQVRVLMSKKPLSVWLRAASKILLTVYFFWLVHRDPYIGLLQSPYNPLHKTTNQGCENCSSDPMLLPKWNPGKGVDTHPGGYTMILPGTTSHLKKHPPISTSKKKNTESS